jgi:glycosyltransferase involved in cell wall biosynthesis
MAEAARGPAALRRGRLLYVITEDWFFFSHFIGMAEAARERGFDVAVATRLRAHRERIEAAGLRAIPFETERASLAPAAALRDARRLSALFRAEQPDIVHAIALKPILLTALAAFGLRDLRCLYAPTGLGHPFVATDFRARLTRAVILMLFGALRRDQSARFLFENADDPLTLGFSPDDQRLSIVSGAGVSPQTFPPLPDPGGASLRVAVVARMVRSKGIEEAVRAIEIARAAGTDVTLDLWGAPDPDNPMSHTVAELEAWSRRPGISWRGRAQDVGEVWRTTHVAMLLSRGGEGLPRSLVEAAASARPIITTDTPGCRVFGAAGGGAFLVPPGDAEAAARALQSLVDKAARDAARDAILRLFQQKMSDNVVNDTVLLNYLTLF